MEESASIPMTPAPEKLKYGTWSQEILNLALAELHNSTNPSINKIARKYSIPWTTLHRHYKNTNSQGRNGIRQLGRPPVFSQEAAEQLVQRMLLLEERMMGVNITMFKNVAFDLAEILGIPHTFNRQSRTAGNKWCYTFLARFKNLLSVRRPRPVSIARLTGFNRDAVDRFFNMYGPLVEEQHITGTSLYNMDESGYYIYQNKRCRVITRKSKHRIGAVSCLDRDVNATAVVCMSPSGFTIPPMLILKGIKLASGAGALDGGLVRVAETGCLNFDLFYAWMEHFIKHSRVSKTNQVMLLLDGHSSHAIGLKALTLAEDNGVIVVSFPPHTTHRMQPLDVGFFQSLNAKYATAIEGCLHKISEKKITQAKFCELFGVAYDAATRDTKASDAFQATGMWPVNREVYMDADFVVAVASKRGRKKRKTTEVNLDDEVKPKRNDTSNTKVSATPNYPTEELELEKEVADVKL